MGGAMLTGMREAIRAFHILRGEDSFGGAAAAQVEKDAVRKRKKVQRLFTPPAAVVMQEACALSSSSACRPTQRITIPNSTCFVMLVIWCQCSL